MNHRAADEYVRLARSRKFSWDGHNCVLFAAGFVKALHGYDPLAGFNGSPKDLREALRAVRSFGSLAGAVTRSLGQPVPPELATYGDVVLISGTEGVGDSLGVCIGANVLAPGEQSLVSVPMRAATLAWKTAPSSS